MTTTGERKQITNWQEVLDRALVVKTLREAMVEADGRETRVLARDVLKSIGEDA